VNAPTAAELDWARAHFAEELGAAASAVVRRWYAQGYLGAAIAGGGDAPDAVQREMIRNGSALVAVAGEREPAPAPAPPSDEELTEARQRLAALGDGRVNRAMHTVGAASFVLGRALAGALDPGSSLGRASIRSVLALVAVLHERPTHAETLAARIAEDEKEATWIEPYHPERAHRRRARAASLRAELAGLEARAAAKLERTDLEAGAR